MNGKQAITLAITGAKTGDFKPLANFTDYLRHHGLTYIREGKPVQVYFSYNDIIGLIIKEDNNLTQATVREWMESAAELSEGE